MHIKDTKDYFYYLKYKAEKRKKHQKEIHDFINEWSLQNEKENIETNKT